MSHKHRLKLLGVGVYVYWFQCRTCDYRHMVNKHELRWLLMNTKKLTYDELHEKVHEGVITPNQARRIMLQR